MLGGIWTIWYSYFIVASLLELELAWVGRFFGFGDYAALEHAVATADHARDVMTMPLCLCGNDFPFGLQFVVAFLFLVYASVFDPHRSTGCLRNLIAIGDRVIAREVVGVNRSGRERYGCSKCCIYDSHPFHPHKIIISNNFRYVRLKK